MSKILCSFVLIAVSFLSPIQASQPDAANPIPAQLRPLELGQLNFLHTTDTHGWHAGHLLEPSFSADWGDYIDLITNLRSQLEAEDRDLIVVDTGDRIEGNGLYDASIPTGKYTFPIFTKAPIDLICSGNHELYKNTSSYDELAITVPAYHENYLASNLDIIDPITQDRKPLARRYKKFTTPKQNITIAAFGFIFDFNRNSNNTIVTPVAVAVKEDWFLSAIADEDVNLFIVIGHIALRQTELDTIYHAIREVQPHTPIQFFGGHYHIRDYRVLDSRAHALASGRFMETIGFQSISGLNTSTSSTSPADIKDPTFFRRYINSNLFSFYRHTSLDASTFHTPLGLNTSSLITKSRTTLKLDEVYGCSPQTYWMSRAPYPHPSSIFSLLTERVFPSITSPTRKHKTRLMISNTGAIRFDIFQGAFTRDSTYIVSPFTSRVMAIHDVPYRAAKQVLQILNKGKQITSTSSYTPAQQPLIAPVPLPSLDFSLLKSPEHRALDSLPHLATPSSSVHALAPNSSSLDHPALLPGYTTNDDLGTDGDDTVASPIAFYAVPNAVGTLVYFSGSGNASSTPVLNTCEHDQSRVNDDDAPEEEYSGPRDSDAIDLVFNEFLQPYVIFILNALGMGDWEYTDGDVLDYLPGTTFTGALSRWVAEEWGGEAC